jgi:hypothetical protein
LIEPSELEAILDAHAFLRVERPPVLWGFAAETETFIRLLGEMLAAALGRNGGALAEVVLNVAGITVEPDEESTVPAGDFVAVTVSAAGSWLPESTWPGGTSSGCFVSADLESAARLAGAAYGYTRQVALDRGSVTVFFPRAGAGPRSGARQRGGSAGEVEDAEPEEREPEKCDDRTE